MRGTAPAPTSVDREAAPRSRTAYDGPVLRGREGPRCEVPADRAAAAAGGRAERPDRPDRRRRLRRVERVRRPVPDADGRAPGRRRAEVHALPHDGAVLADARGAAVGPQPPHGRHGRDHRDRDLGAGLQLGPPEHVRAAGGDPEAQRLRDRAVRQVPRGAGVGDEPGRARSTAGRARRRLRVLLRLHRRRDEPVLPGALRGHDAGRAAEDAGGGLPLHRGHDRQGDRVGPPAEGADAGQAVLRLLRARRDARAASRADGVVGEVQGQVRPGLGRAARGDVRAPEGARRDPAGRRADRAARARSRPGTTCRTSSSRCSRARWRSTPASSSTPTTTSGGWSTRSTTSASSTTRSSTTSSATTARAAKATSTGRSTS